MNKQPIAKTYHANISPGSGDGPVMTLDCAICQGRENTPIANAEELKALIAAKGVTRVMVADTRFLQRGYSTAAYKPQPGRKAPALLDDKTIAKLWR
mgnify:FL=1